MDPRYAVIASGQTLSGQIDLTGRALAAIYCPVIDSAAIAIRASMDQTSTNFLRLQDPRGAQASGDLLFQVGTGSRAALYPNHNFCPAWIQLEAVMSAGSAQTSPRTFVLATTRRN